MLPFDVIRAIHHDREREIDRATRERRMLISEPDEGLTQPLAGPVSSVPRVEARSESGTVRRVSGASRS
jgi:hypothetical protein